MAKNGVIHCPPDNIDRGILRIDTKTDVVTELDVDLLPQRGDENNAFHAFNAMWKSCAVALDGCIYFMPYDARRIMKLDPNNNDAMTSVGDDVYYRGTFVGTVVGIDGCIYGIPGGSRRIVKYDPINDVTSYVGKPHNPSFSCVGNGILGMDGCIYGATTCTNMRALKINTTNNSYCFVGNIAELDQDDAWTYVDAVLGIDGCIYWPPYEASRILKYDPHSNLTSLVGDDFGTDTYKWKGGCLATDGVIYCLPGDAQRILAIDPLKEYTLTLKKNMDKHPEKLGCIFQSSDDIPHVTNFDCAVIKFGQKQVFELLDECIPLVDQVCTISHLYPFMIAASYKTSDLSAIYHLLRQVPFFMNSMNNNQSDSIFNDRNRKHSTSNEIVIFYYKNMKPVTFILFSGLVFEFFDLC